MAGLALLILIAAAGFAGYITWTAPTRAELSVADGAKEAPTDLPLRLRFTRPVTKQALDGALSISPQARLNIAVSGPTATLSLQAPLQELTRYTLRMAGLRDASGGTVSPRSWSFTTTLHPRVVRLATRAGTELADGGALSRDAGLQITFNAEMEAASVVLAVNGAPAALAWTGARQASLNLGSLPVGPLQLALHAGRDVAGRAADVNWKALLNVTLGPGLHTVALAYPALVQIDNVAAARDQSGLQAADAVFEYQTEGGISRFTALFTNAPDAVGPVRSGRYISFKLTRHYQGALFLSGLSQPSYARLRAAPVPVYEDAPYYRTRDRLAPENLYIAGTGLQQAEKGRPQPPTAISHGLPALPPDAAPATTVTVPEHATTYTYDAGTASYTKIEGGREYAEALTGKPLRISLLVVLHAREWVTGDIEDVNGIHARDFDLDSGGRFEAYYEGRTSAGTWSSPGSDRPLQLKLDDGRPLPWPAGLTWVDVVAA